MNKGFQIEIQKDLTQEEKCEAIIFANEWISKVAKENLSWSKVMRTEGGWRSWYRRSALGQRLSCKSNLYFRRASKNRRIFQIVHKDTLHLADGQMDVRRSSYTRYENGIKIVTEKTEDIGEITQVGQGCHCPKCSGQLRVVNHYGDIDCEVYCTIGQIKG